MAIINNGQVIAEHPRSYKHDEQLLDPLHYLVTLGRHPATLDHSQVYCDWELPATFMERHRSLEERHGVFAGARHFIRVLQLHGRHGTERINEAAGYFQSKGLADAELIRQRLEQSGRQSDSTPLEAFNNIIQGLIITVPRPDLNRFNLLYQKETMNISE